MKTYREFLRMKAGKYFESLNCDALFFVQTGKLYTYPEGNEVVIGYGKEMDLAYKEYVKGEGKCVLNVIVVKLRAFGMDL